MVAAMLATLGILLGILIFLIIIGVGVIELIRLLITIFKKD